MLNVKKEKWRQKNYKKIVESVEMNNKINLQSIKLTFYLFKCGNDEKTFIELQFGAKFKFKFCATLDSN